MIPVLEFDDSIHGLRTSSMHCFEGPKWLHLRRGRELFARGPLVKINPQGRCGGVLIYDLQMIILKATQALRFVRQIAQETSGEVVYGLGRQPAVLRTFSQRLSRGFNDAINGFHESLINCDGAEDVIIAVNSTKNLSSTSNPAYAFPFLGGILGA